MLNISVKLLPNTMQSLEIKMKDKEQILKIVDQSTMPPALYAMSMASDVQELIRLGFLKEACEVLNSLKLVIDARLSTKDEFGRHV
jgi:hypothetical protein